MIFLLHSLLDGTAYIQHLARLLYNQGYISAKGQLILKGYFVLLYSPQIKQKISAPVGYGKNLSFQVRLLGELETP